MQKYDVTFWSLFGVVNLTCSDAQISAFRHRHTLRLSGNRFSECVEAFLFKNKMKNHLENSRNMTHAEMVTHVMDRARPNLDHFK